MHPAGKKLCVMDYSQDAWNGALPLDRHSEIKKKITKLKEKTIFPENILSMHTLSLWSKVCIAVSFLNLLASSSANWWWIPRTAPTWSPGWHLWPHPSDLISMLKFLRDTPQGLAQQQLPTGQDIFPLSLGLILTFPPSSTPPCPRDLDRKFKEGIWNIP